MQRTISNHARMSTGRQNHALTAVNQPEPTPQQQRQQQDRIAQARLDQLAAVAAHLPDCNFQQDPQRPGIRATVKGANLAAFGSWDAQTMRLELFNLTPEQAEKLVRFIAHVL